jgi:hypothetical protein
MVRAFVSVFDDDVWRLIQPDQAVGSNRIGVALSAAARAMPRSALECWGGHVRFLDWDWPRCQVPARSARALIEQRL